MTVSQNGWPASPDKTYLGIVNPKVPGTNVDFPQGVKGGDVETVLMYVAEQFHKTVEPLVDGTCWGYLYRQIEGSSSLSNHSSGTAIDCNADHHPMGKTGTFTPAKVSAIRKILSYCEGVVRWGGDYSGRKDEMHFEINAAPAVVARIAAKIKGNVSTVPAGYPATIKKGSTGDAVKHVQQFFHDVFPAYRDSVSVKHGQVISVDGDFGDQTEAWVREFQKRTDITQDGVVGPVTYGQLRHYGFKY